MPPRVSLPLFLSLALSSLATTALSQGLTFDSCTIQSQCQSPRACAKATNWTVLCDSGPPCVCIPPDFTICASPSICMPGETCLATENIFPRCASKEVARGDSSVRVIEKPIGNGLSFDQCVTDSDCISERTCQNTELEPCTGTALICLCIPSLSALRSCSQDDACIDGEVCLASGTSDTAAGICGSSLVPQYSADTKRVQPPAATLLTLDPCTLSSQCHPPRKCLSASDLGPCIDRTDCRCFQEIPCFASDQCDSGEVCAASDGNPFCISPDFLRSTQTFEEVNDTSQTPPPRGTPPSTNLVGTPPEGGLDFKVPAVLGPGGDGPTKTPSDSSQGEVALPPPKAVCIAAAHLSELSPPQRLFKTDVLATVLCDPYGSCATRGHVVLFNGRPMMMGSYCDTASCVEKVLHVNSPRYRRAWRGASFTPGLQFTALAARYETKAEETILSAVVHVGL